MGDGLVTCRGFQRMRERVPEVERLPRAVVVRVAQAERRLEGRAPAHELLVGKLPERLAGEESRLHDLGHSVQPLVGAEGLDERRVDDGARRPVERADEVLALGQVDGRLAADRRVDLADQRRRHRHPWDAAEVRGSGRAAAAEGDERPATIEPDLPPEALRGRDRLRLLAGRHRQYRRIDGRRVELEQAFVRDELGRARSREQVRGHG